MNVSSLKTYLECPRKYRYTVVQRRVDRLRHDPLDLGTLWHQQMDAILQGVPRPPVNLSALSAKAAGYWPTLELALNAWQKPPNWEVIGTELVLALTTPSGVLVEGRLDALIKWNGLYWHVQHKTLSPSFSLPTYWTAMQRDWHECIYQWLATEKGYTPFAGTILNVVRKLTPTAMAKKPSAALSLIYIPRSHTLVTSAVDDFVRVHAQIATDNHFIENRSACRWNNSLCPFVPVCNGETLLSDDLLYKDADDTYATVPSVGPAAPTTPFFPEE